MKIKVYSNNQNIEISGDFEGTNALSEARRFAQNMSAIVALTLSAGKRKEFYENGFLTGVENWEFTDKYFGEIDAICFIAKYSELTITDVARGNLAGLDRAYKTASRRLHPDNRLTGSNEMFLILRRAYDLLKNSQRAQT